MSESEEPLVSVLMPRNSRHVRAPARNGQLSGDVERVKPKWGLLPNQLAVVLASNEGLKSKP